MPNPVLQSRLLGILNDPATQRINFVMGGYEFRPNLYQLVRAAVASGRIDVNANPRRTSRAYYDSSTNDFLFGYSCVDSDTKRALIIHEATHAGCDLRSFRGMAIDVSEGAAYTAQCIFMRLKLGPQRSRTSRLRGTTSATDRVFATAWEIAGSLIQNGFAHRDDVQELRRRVMRTPAYNPSGGTAPVPCAYDGI